MNLLSTLPAFVVALGLLIVFHELGHYAVARMCGVKVLRFSVGFGRVLWSRRAGPDATEWALCALPLGGYVKMLDEREGEVQPFERARAFNAQPVGKRIAIVAAGPLANLLLAVLLYWILLMQGLVGLKPLLGEPAPDSRAAQAGIVDGDEVLAVNGEAVRTWQELRWQLVASHGDAQVMLALAGGRQAAIPLPERLEPESDVAGELGLAPFDPPGPARIDSVAPGSAAQRAGLRAGDRIVRVAEREVVRWSDVTRVVRAHPGKLLRIEIMRGGERLALDITPDAAEVAGERIGRLGVEHRLAPEQLEALIARIELGPGAALAEAAARTWNMATFSLEMLGRMVLGEVSWKNISGPVTIADYAGQSARAGWEAYLGFLALISISLGVLNLLPIPLLDGGHLLYYFAEIVKGSPVSERAMDVGQRIGLGLLGLLMALAFYNDLARLLTS
jgi:regulator of sigma E protease